MTCASLLVATLLASPLQALGHATVKMADALCGPSNPLQQFKQQTQFDRTLQQDRLTSRHSPAQGFRSHDPNIAHLDAEFEAFQAGVSIPELPRFQQQPPSFAAPSQAPSWATDFQRMQISPASSFYQNVSQPGQVSNNWTQGFREHVGQSTPRAQSSVQSPQAFQYRARYGTSGFQNSLAQMNFAHNSMSKGKEPVTEQFDEAAFERAFDQAREDMMSDVEAMEVPEVAYEAGASTGNYQDLLDQDSNSQSIDADGKYDSIAGREEPNNLALDQEMQEQLDTTNEAMLREDETLLHSDSPRTDQFVPPQDDDALADTARELLQRVEHNQSDKFRNSQFLSLMRKLRDREMKVDGDKMVETSVAENNVRVAPVIKPSSPLAHDSAYGSGTATPSGYPRALPRVEFDTHIPFVQPRKLSMDIDHWESPYR